jgi:hypothetical protein
MERDSEKGGLKLADNKEMRYEDMIVERYYNWVKCVCNTSICSWESSAFCQSFAHSQRKFAQVRLPFRYTSLPAIPHVTTLQPTSINLFNFFYGKLLFKSGESFRSRLKSSSTNGYLNEKLVFVLLNVFINRRIFLTTVCNWEISSTQRILSGRFLVKSRNVDFSHTQDSNILAYGV